MGPDWLVGAPFALSCVVTYEMSPLLDEHNGCVTVFAFRFVIYGDMCVWMVVTAWLCLEQKTELSLGEQTKHTVGSKLSNKGRRVCFPLRYLCKHVRVDGGGLGGVCKGKRNLSVFGLYIYQGNLSV